VLLQQVLNLQEMVLHIFCVVMFLAGVAHYVPLQIARYFKEIAYCGVKEFQRRACALG
jgi:hypothetical protein